MAIIGTVTADVSDRAGRLLGVVSGGANVFHVDDNGGSLTVDGTVGVNNFPATQPISGTVTANQGTAGAAAWKVDGSAVTQPISAVALPLPAGAATDASITNGNARIGGTVTVDGSAHTQPVSGSVSTTQGTSPWVVDDQHAGGVTVPVSAASLPLPAGAATSAKQAQEIGALSDIALTAILEREKVA